MRTHARVVIIGAGIVGCSTAYYLAQLGWRDIVVLEQGPLAVNWGSSSHAPGLMFQHNNSRAVTQLAQWSVETYLRVQPPNERLVWQTGSFEIAHTPERWEELKRKLGNARAWGLPAELVGPDDVKRLVPIMRTDDLYGAFYVPSDADVNAAGLCAAMRALAAADGAAEFHEYTPVTGIEVADGQVRGVVTPQGRIAAEQVVCAAGLWGPLVGRMAGVRIPLMPCQHLYVRTQPLPELRGETEIVRHPVVRYQDQDMYFRQHGEAYGFGSYRHEPLMVAAQDLPHDDHPAIFPFTPEHMEVSWRDAIRRIPALAGAQVAHQFNGLFSFTADGNSIVGETPEVRGFWAVEAVWVTHAGGVGRALAEWMDTGLPPLDLRELDINRFHPHAFSRPFLRERAERQYIEVYDIIHPLQPAARARGLRVSPIHARLEALGAFFTEGAGWERPQWFAYNETRLHSGPHTWPARSGWAARFWSPLIGAEHHATREAVGLFDLSAFAKLEISGPGALGYLQKLAANQMDTPVGRITYTALLTERGGIKADLTITRLSSERFWLITGAGSSPMDFAWLRRHLPADGSVVLTDLTSTYAAIGVWGSRARDLVQSVSENDLSNAAFGYLTAQDIFVGYVPVRALRISYAGELGWELYTPAEYGLKLWDTLWEAGQPLGAAPVGGGAFDSLRLEKGYRLWGSELHTDHNPYGAGLGFAVRLNKGDFIGRDALRQIKAAGPARRLSCLVFDDPTVALMGKEPIFDGEHVLGYVTSANYGYSVQRSLAYGYLPAEFTQPGARAEVYYFGQRFPATVMAEPLFDPGNDRMKA
jgi:glycine cleavage system aminomethyltransferase T/glycine/D-amino acid oxidase-like deaminating enzyme